ncbi:unnamed protein product, partial [Brenthis ino]
MQQQVRREARRARQFASQIRVAAAMRPDALRPRSRPMRLPPVSDNVTINVAWTLFGRYVIADCGSP